jgi:long-chain acyl-CoA synthetase
VTRLRYHPRAHALDRPSAPAVILGQSGAVISYGELEHRSNQLAQLFRARSLEPGDHIAIVMENHPRFFEIVWAAQRCGLYYTAINWHLRAEEVEYVIRDAGARALITSSLCAPAIQSIDIGDLELRLIVDGSAEGFEPYDAAVAGCPVTAVPDECEGSEMLYSSGTTGLPKGIRKPLPGCATGDPASWHVQTAMALHATYGFGPQTTYLSPAPLYHAAPLVWCMGMHRIGAAVVVMERFDATDCLALIERYGVTVAQFVPTMFIRLLKLPDEVRARYETSSLELVLHAAAPCPVEVKRRMLEWWGPIIHEYYSGTENVGSSGISPEEWLAHPGSVGRPASPVHIVSEDGEELPVGSVGTIYFEGGDVFEYHNDPAKTASIVNERGWRTLGDVGYLDDDGYLYLTDRQINMIVSGGVNIYPQEAENALSLHPSVSDVAVIGVPDEELGEQVKAIVVPAGPAPDPALLEEELLTFCRASLSAFKCPRSVDFVEEVPRDENGKLYKRWLRERYWQGHETGII